MKAIILAAGQSKRMKSSLLKTLHPMCGKPVIKHITDACRQAGVTDITIVIGNSDEQTQKIYTQDGVLQDGIRFAVQRDPQGTGHAVQSALEASAHFADDDEILVLAGDMPLLTADFIRGMADCYRSMQSEGQGCAAVVSAVHWPTNTDFGHVYADADGFFIETVEARDLTEAHEHTPLRGTSCYLFNGAALKQGLKQLTNANAQNEYYLTDVPKHIKGNGGLGLVKVFCSDDDTAIFTGINTQVQLAEAAAVMRRRINIAHMVNGVRMIDPTTTYIDTDVQIAPEAIIYPGVVIEGASTIAQGARILAHSVISDASVGAFTQIGPFAYLRPGTVIGEKCRIGNFVEVKNANIGNQTNAAHLTYIGDADVGSQVNVGCGVITANYDGKNKSRTTIHDRAFIGSNTNLIAPVEIGEGAFIAAGSTINKSVPPSGFAIARARQEVKENWNNDPRNHAKKS
ncbi:MAG: bifunctional UDP-N-acetylglucosamine diphosphorylase/glucosamine-1-phosphate N-acetyltransferase GlmU [Defluviitaleaceae bacterium]|nr:bifunctional UDP-N-acetylglucosamine diphosphorylase/glucosamine-1-phosphate N-acetyltransferase GlmU [Defluviitaleaceae bacterium]